MKKIILTAHLVLFLLIVSISFSSAQQANNWYFGSAGCQPNTGMRIDFTSGSPVVSIGSPQLTQEGSSSISDAVTGAPLFFTDGTNAWNASTFAQFNTFPLGGGSSSSQSAIILPKPGTTNQWFIFTVDVNGNNGAQYVTVQLVAGVYSIIEASPVSLVGAGVIGEGLCIIGSTKAGSKFWVIVRDRASTGQIRAFEVTSAGAVITTAVTSSLSGAGFTNTNYNQYIGIIKSNTCQNKLAFTYYNNDADIAGFNPATGQLIAGTAKRILSPSSGGLGHSYGLEFSPNDLYLYLTALDEGKVYQYDITTAAATTLVGDVNPGSTANNEAGQLQLAPDGNIYMARMNGTCPATSYLAKIASPNLAAPTFTANAVLLSGVLNGSGYNGGSFRGLPTFTKSLISQSLTASPGNGGYCVNTNIPLSYVFGGSVASQSWTITPGSVGVDWVYVTGTSTSAAPTIKFLTANTYTVTANVVDNCGNNYSYPLTYNITVPKVPAGKIDCNTGSLTLVANGTVPADYPNYVWYDAASGGNIVGVGSSVTYNNSDFSHTPSSFWVEVAGSVSTSSAANQAIGPATGTLTWGGRGTGNYSTTFTTFATSFTLKSFSVTPQSATGTFDVEIKNASNTVVFLKNYTAGAVGVAYTVAINVDLPPSTYTITLKNSGSIVWGGGSWAGAINAQVNLPTTGGAGTYGIANMIYDYKNFTTTSTCSNRVLVSRKCLTVLPGDGTYCTNNNITLSYSFEGTATGQLWTITPGSLGVDWVYVTGTSASAGPTIKFLTTGTYTVNVDVTDISTVVYSRSQTFTIIAGNPPAASLSCGSPTITLNATGTVPADYPKYMYYDAATGGNIVGGGNPVTVSYSNPLYAPASFWVEVASSVSVSSGSSSIGTTTGWTWNGNTPTGYNVTGIAVLADVLTLKTFDIKISPWPAATCNNVTFDVEIRDASNTVVFLKTGYNTGAYTCGNVFTVNVNTTLYKGNTYKITLKNFAGGSGITYLYGGTWAGGTNAGQITYPSQGVGTNSIGNLTYDYKNFTTTAPSCAGRVQITNTCALPIELLSFTGASNGNKNFLFWTTISEKNNDYFEIQKSTDNMHFTTIGTVKGNGTTTSVQDYNFTDNNATGAITYYRLVQHDYNGETSSSAIISIESNSGSSVIVAPNPSHDAFTVTLQNAGEADLIVLDILGRVLQTAHAAKGLASIKIGEALESGSYILQVKTSNQVFVERLIKE